MKIQKNKADGIISRVARNVDRAATLAGLMMTYNMAIYSATFHDTFDIQDLVIMTFAKIATASIRYATEDKDARTVWGIGRSLVNVVYPPLGYVADALVESYDAIDNLGNKAYTLSKGDPLYKKSGIEECLREKK